MQTPYARRIALAAIVSLLGHAALFAVLTLLPRHQPVEASAPPPVRVRLQAPPPAPETEAARRLVEAVQEDAPPEQPTDLIAEVDSRARDMRDEQSDDAAPAVDQLDDYERLAALPGVPETPPLRPAPALEQLEPLEPERPEPTGEPPAAPTEEPRRSEAEAPRPVPAEPRRTEVAQAPPETREPVQREDNPTLREQRAPEVPASGSPGPSRGRMQGAVMSKGFLGFEAMRDEIAPYLRHVQERVERQWRLSMELEYRGTARARAVVDCSIMPSGELAFVRIVDDGDDPNFAAFCASAIRRSGPFNPFPFEVPALYRDEEIVIRWTFQFL